MLTVKMKGDWSDTKNMLNDLSFYSLKNRLNYYGMLGVKALMDATPKDTGLTSQSWGFDVDIKLDSVTITWTNSNVKDGWANIALLLQYGHATRNHGYVSGRDYINPAMKPVFEKIENDAWKEVIKE